MNFLLIGAGIAAAVMSVAVVVLAVGIGINLATRVPYAGTPPKRIEAIFDCLPLQPGSRVYDLGCGDGRVVFAAARRGAIATGYEIQPLPYLRAKIVQLIRYPGAKIRFGSFYAASLADADVVFCFLVDAVMPNVARHLERKLPAGCRVVCYGFELPGWQPKTVLHHPPSGRSKIFIYQT